MVSGSPLRFEPTYKELKLSSVSIEIYAIPGFEPTYKELKQRRLPAEGGEQSSFEPTYKELKQGSYDWFCFSWWEFWAYL